MVFIFYGYFKTNRIFILLRLAGQPQSFVTILNSKIPPKSLRSKIQLLIYFFNPAVTASSTKKIKSKVLKFSPTGWHVATATPCYLSLRSKV